MKNNKEQKEQRDERIQKEQAEKARANEHILEEIEATVAGEVEPEVIEGSEVEIEVEGENPFQAQLLEKENMAKEYLDKFQRTMAEYDNFRKRTMKEKSQMYENGAKEVFEKIIPIVDNFERALGSVPTEEKESAFAQGIEMIYKQLVTTLVGLGVEEMDAMGKPFDPNLHHAVAHEENEDFDANVIVEVFQKGYLYKERVLRFCMVKVAN